MRSTRAAIRALPSAFLVAAAIAVGGGLATYAAGLWPSVEHRTVDARFALRGSSRPQNMLLVTIDGTSLQALGSSFPLPRSDHARALDALRSDGAGAIVYDLQFTEPTRYSEDLALYRAVERAAGHVVLVTTETNDRGQADVLGGPAQIAHAHATVAAANLPTDEDGVIRRYPYSIIGLPSVAVATAELVTGRPVSRSGFDSRGALIDYRGPPGTIPSVHFSDLLAGHVDPRVVRGRTVVVGVTAPTLADFHTTSASRGDLMSGPEVLANSIWTAEAGNPLRTAPGWLTVVLILIGGLAAPLLWLRLPAPRAALLAVGLAAVYLVSVQLAFSGGTLLVVTYPLFALAVGTFSMVTAGYVAETLQKREVTRQAGVLLEDVHHRDRQLQASQIEIVQRLAQAAESRDEDTGMHIVRIGNLCHDVGLELGMKPQEAELLRYASAMHDIGKIAIPDSILRKQGRLDGEEWEIMKSHAARGAAILAGSSSPLVRMAETIALTHHERWDGKGYPNGLKGEEIPLVGRVSAICDVFDALTSRRPYKDAWPIVQTLAELRNRSGTQFDPKVVDAFMTVLQAADPARSDVFMREGSAATGPAAEGTTG